VLNKLDIFFVVPIVRRVRESAVVRRVGPDTCVESLFDIGD